MFLMRVEFLWLDGGLEWMYIFGESWLGFYILSRLIFVEEGIYNKLSGFNENM